VTCDTRLALPSAGTCLPGGTLTAGGGGEPARPRPRVLIEGLKAFAAGAPSRAPSGWGRRDPRFGAVRGPDAYWRT
jgi:hypothetical protein